MKSEALAIVLALLPKKELHKQLRMPCVLSMSSDSSNRKSGKLIPIMV